MPEKKPHILNSLQTIVEEVPEPWRMALLQKARQRGIMYVLKCINPAGLRTRWAGVDRAFTSGESKMLPADIAAALWNLFNVATVAGSVSHPTGNSPDSPAPYLKPNFEEVVDWNRTDLGPEVVLRKGGASLQEELLQDVKEPEFMGRGRRTTSDEPSVDEIHELTGGTPGGPPRPLTSQEV
jgi:hypothetical protein